MNTGIEIRQDLISDQSGETEWAERLATIFIEIEVELRTQALLPAA
jgi:predicted N-formylglutamate amidohydrolase